LIPADKSEPGYSELGLARLALSKRLKDLSEELRTAVAEPDNPAEDPDSALADRIWRLLDDGVPALRDELVAYLRARDTPWSRIGARAGLTEQEAGARWGRVEPSHLDKPGATAAALDQWYVHHAQVEPLADVADPVSRLLGTSAPQQERCLICAKYAGETVPAWAGRPVPPGGHLVDDGTWRVGHGPTPFWPRGTLLIESRRHFLDHTEITPGEATSLALLMRRLTEPIKEATGADRVHVWSCMEGTPHFHTWLVPRVGEVTSGRAFIGGPGYCTEAEAEETVHAIRKALGSLEPTGADE
jgi:diadenosine tetraphosphate (Ap4A) HIT family hydrolase